MKSEPAISIRPTDTRATGQNSCIAGRCVFFKSHSKFVDLLPQQRAAVFAGDILKCKYANENPWTVGRVPNANGRKGFLNSSIGRFWKVCGDGDFVWYAFGCHIFVRPRYFERWWPAYCVPGRDGWRQGGKGIVLCCFLPVGSCACPSYSKHIF